MHMNSLGSRDGPFLSCSQYSDERNCRRENAITDSSECPSSIHFADTPYTLSFGQLFSGNLQCHQSSNLVCRCVPSCLVGRSLYYPTSCYDVSPMSTCSSQPTPLVNSKVNQAMRTIRRTVEDAKKPYNSSIPSVPYCYNPITNNPSQNNITKAAVLLEHAANVMSFATNRQKLF